MTKITFVEIHSMQFGLTDGEIEECYLNNGVIEQPRTIYCFKKDEEDYSPRVVYLFNHKGEGKKVMGDALELLLHSSGIGLISEFFGISKKAMGELLWMTVRNGDRDTIPTHFSDDNFVESTGPGGEVNVSNFEEDLKAAKSTCLISFSQFANCDFEMNEDLTDLTEPDLEFTRHLDKREVARIYYGDK